ncbi:FAD binding domain-containing protein [Thermosipho ferrireducens]|uniref:FAD binding domain-containing protein n=1 Tax=Thermosipho ferrireducens TaxID=2571116 RepID=A0ABX7S633_9BACT|nr:FAD binding domain-containing protein [Thermosipho ferrireducens]QTA37205.1 FAD binding domain-containing protein [Thermosipho ferrireducens]
MIVNYFRPKTIEEIAKIKQDTGGVLFSGGTDLFVKLRANTIKTDTVIDTKYIEKIPVELKSELIIPLNTTYSEIREILEQKKQFSPLVEIIKTIGSPMIRNRGTPIGNLGNASPAGDFLLACYLYDAEVTIEPTKRKCHISDFIKGPGKVDLSREEFIYAVKIPNLDGYEYYFEKVGRRNAMIISIVSLGILLKRNQNKIEDIRIAYGSVAPTIVRFKDIERSLIGKELTLEMFEEIAKEYQHRVNPITDVRASKEYRKKLVYNLLLKAYNHFKI